MPVGGGAVSMGALGKGVSTNSASAWTPMYLPDLAVWLDAAQITGLVDGGTIATWSDMSGSGNHVTQATEANKPTYQTNEQNGLSVVRFDATDLLIRTFGAALTQPLTIVAVVKTGADVTNNVQYDGGIALNARCVQYVEASAFRLYGGAALVDSAVSVATATWYYVIAIFNGASSSIEVSGSTATTGDAGAFDHNGITLGQDYNQNGSFPWAGDIAEYLTYDSLLSAAHQTLVRDYVKNKWGL